jgi:hypothetical protein
VPTQRVPSERRHFANGEMQGYLIETVLDGIKSRNIEA